METALQKVFDYNGNNVRTTIKNGEIWFVARDVCEILELGNVTRAVSRLENDEKGVTSSNTLGGKQEITVINEPGLYSLIFTSRKEEAKIFKRWVTHEVIPSIRKTGKYEAPSQSITETILGLISNPDFQNLKASAQSATIKAISKDNAHNKNINTNHVTGGSLLKQLLENAVPLATFIPRSVQEVKSSVLYDENYFYIFPGAIHRYLGKNVNKMHVYSEIKFLDGINKSKKFNFLKGKNSEAYHVWILPRESVNRVIG